MIDLTLEILMTLEMLEMTLEILYCCWRSTHGHAYSVKESTFHLQMHEGYRPLGFK